MTWLDTERTRNPHPIPVVIPERFVGAQISGIPDKTLRATSKKFLQDFYNVAAQGIAPVFLGATGQYKTFAAAAIANLTSPVAETYWVNCPEDIGRLSLARFTPETVRTIDRWSTVPFLIMDDFAINPKGFGAEVLQIIASARFAATRPTLWTGNVSPDWDQITAAYGAMFSRRLRDGGRGYTVEI